MGDMANEIKLLSGNSHPDLARRVADRYVLCAQPSDKYRIRLNGANEVVIDSLGIDIAKTLSLQYSNQETSVTVGESVRDEDGQYLVLVTRGPFLKRET